MDKSRLESYSFLALFAGVALLLFFIFSPFIQILGLAAVFATIFHTSYVELAKKLNGFESLAAFIIVIVALIFFIVPIFFVGSYVFHEAQNLYADVQVHGTEYAQALQRAVETPIQRVYPDFSFDISASSGSAFTLVSTNLASLVSQTLFLTLATFLMLLAVFFLLIDGGRVLTAITEASPFGKAETSKIITGMYDTLQAVLNGMLVVGVIRFIFIAIGFYALGIPNAILWSAIGGIVSIVPGLGTPFAFIPAIIFLYLQGHTLAALAMTVLGLAVIVVVDNILVPHFFAKGLPVPAVFVLFSFLGGIIFFGPLGFIWGPLVLSVFLSLFQIYTDAPQTDV